MRRSAVFFLPMLFSLNTLASTPFYAEFHAGETSQSVKNHTRPSPNGEDTSIGVVGGYQLNEFIAVELRYMDMGSITQDQGNAQRFAIQTSHMGAGIRLSLPVNDSVTLFAKAAYVESEVDQNIGLPTNAGVILINETDDHRAVLKGFGARVMLTEDAYIGLKHSWYDHDSDSGLGYTNEIETTAFFIGTYF